MVCRTTIHISPSMSHVLLITLTCISHCHHYLNYKIFQSSHWQTFVVVVFGATLLLIVFVVLPLFVLCIITFTFMYLLLHPVTLNPTIKIK